MDEYRAALWSIKGIGPKCYTKLLQTFGSPPAIFEAPVKELKGILSEKIIESIKSVTPEKIYQIRNQLNSINVRVIDFTCDEYPEHFKHSEIFPPVLFLRGRNLNFHRKIIAVVGTRTPSWYGIEVTKKLVKELVRNGFTIISGGARGIDTVAHKSALEEGGTTIAIMGCGFNFLYPPENKELFNKIAENGTLISEFSLDTKPLRENFPKRNRIIAGLSDAVVVVEAGEKSGALITARWAAELGKDVYAVPGSILSPFSSGTNKLISQGAKILTNFQDIFEDFGLLPAKFKTFKEIKITPEQNQVLKVLNGEPLHIDQILNKTGLNIHELLSLLFELELKNLVKELPGKFYVKNLTSPE
ncbi:MAG: DNA-processing protein DprA [candidate division WOR-3 bacterium]